VTPNQKVVMLCSRKYDLPSDKFDPYFVTGRLVSPAVRN
jgi:hypothetical protein